MATSVNIESAESGAYAPEPDQQDFSQDPGRPEWLPPEFKSVEDFRKSYDETKAAYTQARQELANRTGEDGSDLEAPSQDQHQEQPDEEPLQQQDNLDQAAAEAAEKANFDLAPYQEEYFTQGDVSEESREAIAEGLQNVFGDQSRSIVDQFVETRKVTHQNDTRMYHEAAGGKERLDSMTQWASDNLDRSYIDEYNRQVNSGDRSTTLFAIEGLKARYESVQGRQPVNVTSGRVPAHGSVRPFTSSAEMVRAMQDTRYKEDPAYRKDVQDRLSLSNFE